MVDRGWQRSKKNVRDDRTVLGHGSQKAGNHDITITIAGPRSSGKPPSTTAKRTTEANRAQERKVSVQFMQYEPPVSAAGQASERCRRTARRAKSVVQRRRGQAPSAAQPIVSPSPLSVRSSTLRQSIPGSASPLYTFIDPEVSSFQEFIAYCRSPYLV